ncbi:outer membrane protein assembly factor BamB family protein [Azohydromonas lata]|uniref:outer membrane protein assembly factor BamB family protein n=1 Tax=Azohydromonas lata TaxID=45677 RepID=UPI003898F421
MLQGKLFTTFSGGPSLEARDAASGRLLWTRRICIGTPPACTYASVAGPLAAGDGIVYVTNHANGMAAYDMDSGRQLWSRTVGSGGIYSAPVVEGDAVYVSDHNGQLHALNRRTGAQLWSAPTGRFNHSTPALANGVLYAGGDSGLTAIDARTGAVRWVQSAVGTVVTSPAVANGVVYLGGKDGRLYVLDALTGEVLHSRQIAPADRELVSSPMVADGVLYMNTGDRMLAFGL